MDLVTAVLFFIGFGLLILGAEVLVRGSSRLAVAAGISPLVVGLTVVAYGTSAPELAVTVQSVYSGQADIAIGNVVGSNIANILLILGISATVAPLVVSQQLVRSDVPIMIGLSFVMYAMAWHDRQISRWEGLLLFAGAVGYTVMVIRQSRQDRKEKAAAGELPSQEASIEPLQIGVQIGYIVVGLGMLVLGSRWLINGAVALAEILGVSELIVGLTIIAAGTSLPEIATSIVAGLRGERDIAVGNAVGSNIFNILLVLGVCSAVAPSGVPVSQAAINFDIPVMIVVALAALPVFFTGYSIARWEGFLFVGYYGAYTLFLYLNATQHEALSSYNFVMVTFVLPLTGLTLLILAAQYYRQRRTSPPA